mmetsp:Transcript_4169/g.13695  ORF Transcript_4169/g.13695 Transcript_4169/m.13695 type:complete len:239 (-) Transcript_4169:321-1037(-)
MQCFGTCGVGAHSAPGPELKRLLRRRTHRTGGFLCHRTSGSICRRAGFAHAVTICVPGSGTHSARGWRSHCGRGRRCSGCNRRGCLRDGAGMNACGIRDGGCATHSLGVRLARAVRGACDSARLRGRPLRTGRRGVKHTRPLQRRPHHLGQCGANGRAGLPAWVEHPQGRGKGVQGGEAKAPEEGALGGRAGAVVHRNAASRVGGVTHHRVFGAGAIDAAPQADTGAMVGRSLELDHL